MQEFLIANGYPALFLLSFLAATLIPLGSEWLLVLLIVGGFAPLPVVMVATAGNFLGACTSYAIGIYGSAFLTAKFLRMEVSNRARAEQYDQHSPDRLRSHRPRDGSAGHSGAGPRARRRRM